jgi:hypothetical protein
MFHNSQIVHAVAGYVMSEKQYIMQVVHNLHNQLWLYGLVLLISTKSRGLHTELTVLLGKSAYVFNTIHCAHEHSPATISIKAEFCHYAGSILALLHPFLVFFPEVSDRFAATYATYWHYHENTGCMTIWE